MSQYVYSIEIDAAGLFGGTVKMVFYPYQNYDAGPIAVFSGEFGGLVGGAASTWGTAWLNYGVDWLADQKWSARFEANFAAVAVNVNLWGLSGEVIGNTASGGVGVLAGIVGGQGSFFRQ